MSNFVVNGAFVSCSTPLGSALNDILKADDIVPGSQPGYATCKLLYVSHPLGSKIVEAPVKLAVSKKRIVTVEDAPTEVVKAFEDTRKKLRADYFVRNTMYLNRIYGTATLACGFIDKDNSQPLDLNTIHKEEVYFVAFDSLNTSGSGILDINPNSPGFLLPKKDFAIAGKPWGRGHTVTIQNGPPIYLEWSASAYSFGGRSVFVACLFQLKSFIQTMITDDMVSRKAGLLVAFMKATGSIVNALQQAAASIKRFLLKQGGTGEVLGVTSEDKIESLDLQNIDKAMITARSNIIDNIASAVPMPARLLKQEAFAEGFGEGEEDTKEVIRASDEIREEMQPLYDFSDTICMHVAWNPEFIQTLRAKYPEIYTGRSDADIFYSLKNNYKAAWPNLLEEPESEKAKQDKVKCEGLVAILQELRSMANENGQQALVEWVAGNIGEYTSLFPIPLSIDPADFTRQSPDPGELDAGSEADPDATAEPEPTRKGLKAVK
jgi:hypothetical protein